MGWWEARVGWGGGRLGWVSGRFGWGGGRHKRLAKDLRAGGGSKGFVRGPKGRSGGVVGGLGGVVEDPGVLMRNLGEMVGVCWTGERSRHRHQFVYF